MNNKTALSAADDAARPKKQQRASKPRGTNPEASKSIYDDFRQKGYEVDDIDMAVGSDSKTPRKTVKDAVPGTHVGHVGAAPYIHWVTLATRGVLFWLFWTNCRMKRKDSHLSVLRNWDRIQIRDNDLHLARRMKIGMGG